MPALPEHDVPHLPRATFVLRHVSHSAASAEQYELCLSVAPDEMAIPFLAQLPGEHGPRPVWFEREDVRALADLLSSEIARWDVDEVIDAREDA